MTPAEQHEQAVERIRELRALDRIVRVLTDKRRVKGWSMHDLALRVGVSSSSIHAWEHGIKSPTLVKLRLWAAALDYDVTLTERKCSCGVTP